MQKRLIFFISKEDYYNQEMQDLAVFQTGLESYGYKELLTAYSS